MLRLGTPEQFRIAGDFLRTEYSEQVVAAELGVPSVGAFDQRDPSKPIRHPLVRLFFGGAAMEEAEVRGAIPDPAFSALEALGLLARERSRVHCPVLLYPSYGVLLVSDRFHNPEGEKIEGDREFVYFALTANTQNYVAMLAESPCDSFLDVGAGCGAAALAQARFAQHAWSADISARCTEFAEFGRRLSGIENVTVVEGSLYEPVAGRQFDRIGCHPPYDISLSSKWTFADGGDDGEFVIRGVIEGLPQMLAPGGRFTGLARVGESSAEPIESKVRRWLGSAQEEFDVLIVQRDMSSLRDYAIASVMTTSRRFEDLEEYQRRFERWGVEQLAYCHFVIERKKEPGTALTLRKELGERCTWREIDGALSWARRGAEIDLSKTALRISEKAVLVVKHRVVDGELEPSSYSFSVTAPFRLEFECPEWIAAIVSRFDGKRSTEEAYTLVRQQIPIPPAQFDHALRELISAGVLEWSQSPQAGI